MGIDIHVRAAPRLCLCRESKCLLFQTSFLRNAYGVAAVDRESPGNFQKMFITACCRYMMEVQFKGWVGLVVDAGRSVRRLSSAPVKDDDAAETRHCKGVTRTNHWIRRRETGKMISRGMAGSNNRFNRR